MKWQAKSNLTSCKTLDIPFSSQLDWVSLHIHSTGAAAKLDARKDISPVASEHHFDFLEKIIVRVQPESHTELVHKKNDWLENHQKCRKLNKFARP